MNKKLDIDVYKFDEKVQKKSENPTLLYEWTHKIRMISNINNYNHFVDLFLAPIYQIITCTLIPRLPLSCKDCIQLGSKIQFVD